jgi:PPOX class probable F420-dependent enzyme
MPSDANSVLTPDQAQFLTEHTIAAFATGRKDGSPQLSHVVYDYDGNDIVISVKSYTAKWHNARRQPRVALLVHEGRKQLVIYGRAEAVDQDPARADLTARVFSRMTGKQVEANEGFIDAMNQQKRTVLRITPESASMMD